MGRAVAVERDDFLAEVTHAEHQAREAGFFQQADLMGEKRLPRDLEEKFGHFLGDRAEAFGQTAREDGDRKIGRLGRRGRHGRLGGRGYLPLTRRLIVVKIARSSFASWHSQAR